MTGRVNIKIKYNGTDLADLQTPIDSVTLTIYSGMLKQKFDAANAVLDEYNVQSQGISATDKTLDANVELADLNHLNMDLEDFDLSARLA